jgi:hypothetical protein
VSTSRMMRAQSLDGMRNDFAMADASLGLSICIPRDVRISMLSGAVLVSGL